MHPWRLVVSVQAATSSTATNKYLTKIAPYYTMLWQILLWTPCTDNYIFFSSSVDMTRCAYSFKTFLLDIGLVLTTPSFSSHILSFLFIIFRNNENEKSLIPPFEIMTITAS